ncbi:hypothetical protein PPYR_05356 [Photinus pyralis]|nr:protein tyrosine phosphatase type IVA 1-like [Photinus pyralis]KAB0801002.1 hypothetical protein PPYR_05356 [Photinus pyralis]
MAFSIEAITSFHFNHLKLVLCRQPNLSMMNLYIEQLKEQRIRTIVKVCETDYCISDFEDNGIEVRELVYKNGSFPSNGVIEIWINFVKAHFEKFPNSAIGIHCVDGLGRSAVLVALALIEGGLDPVRAIEFIKSKRRGAFNKYQEKELQIYKSYNRLVIHDY